MRPRKTNRNLPPCVYLRHGAFYLVKLGKWTRLASDYPSALREYARLHTMPEGGMAKLIDMALAQRKPKLSANTWAQYQTAARKLKEMLAEFAPHQVKPKDVAMVKVGLADTPNMANRVISVLRLVFNYAVEQQLVDSNPAIGIQRHAEAKRKRLVSKEEFQAIYTKAGQRLQVVMDLLYLTGQRVVDVLQIKYSDLREDGVYFEQAKTDARLIVEWTPELRAVVERAKTLHGNVRALTLLHNRRGKAPDYSTVKIQWDVARKAAGVEDATMRDLRAMSGTATNKQGKNATALLGHTSPAMTVRYLRDKEIPVVEGPSFGRWTKGD